MFLLHAQVCNPTERLLLCFLEKDLTDAIEKVAVSYKCVIAEGVFCHETKQFVLNANKVIFCVGNPESSVEDAELRKEKSMQSLLPAHGRKRVYSLRLEFFQ